MARGFKTGGRSIGTPNKLTKELRVLLKDVLFKELYELHVHLDKLQPKERLEIIIKLMPYVMPRIETIQMEKGEGSFNDWNTE